MNISRRNLIGGMAAATVPVAAVAPEITPRERLDAAMKELKAAAQAFDPSIRHWNLSVSEDDDLSIRIAAVAYNW